MPVIITDQPIRRPFGEDNTTSVLAEATTTGGYVGFIKRRGYNEVLIRPNGGTLGVRMAMGIPIQHAYFFDASLSGALRWLDYGHAFDPNNNDLMDGMKTGTKVTPAMTSSDFIYLAMDEPGSGFHFKGPITAAQTSASVANVDVSTSKDGWTNHAAGNVTDTTETPAGDVFGSDGEISLDVVPGVGITPDWVPAKLVDLVGSDALDIPTTPQGVLARDTPYYWARIAVNNTTTAITFSGIMGCDTLLDHSTTKGSNASSAAYLVEQQSYTFDVGDSIGGLLFCSQDTDATTTMDISWMYRT